MDHVIDIGYQAEEEKDEYKYYQKQITHTSHSYQNINFKEPQESDYIDCKSNNHEAKNCRVLQRIFHLLLHYQQVQNNKHHIYEYLSSLKNYDFPTFMEDWHQCKINHLKGQAGVGWIQNAFDIRCDSTKQCQYVSRYQRERGGEIHDDMSIH
eukprot:449450_1